FRTVVDPYGGGGVLPGPPIPPGVGIGHAWRADEDGNVQFPWPPGHPAHADAPLARAPATTHVPAEAVLPPAPVTERSERTRLFGFEVDLLVEAAGGARPGSLPPVYDEDEAWLEEHAGSVGKSLLEESGRPVP